MSTLLLAAAATLVFCAPGYPGGAGDAQPLVDQFAKATAAAAGWPQGSLDAVYDPTEPGGLEKLRSPAAAVAFVPYPFYVEHAAELRLTALAQADVTAVGTEERWTLVAKSGQVTDPASMAGYTLVSIAGYAPDFVRHSALRAWPLPANVKIEATSQILSALRRVATGEHVAVLLDKTQAAALATLPFAAQLKTVAQSAPLPVALLAVVGSRLSAERARGLRAALLQMSHSGNADTLAPLQLQGFVEPQLPGPSAAP